MKKLLYLSLLMVLVTVLSCERQPPLHLYDGGEIDVKLPNIEVGLEVYWDYQLIYGIKYDWRAEWWYGWDEEDIARFGVLAYTEPTKFYLTRYYTAQTPYAPHTSEDHMSITDHFFNAKFAWGYWDMLVRNEIEPTDSGDVVSLNFDTSSLDSVIAYTNQSMTSSRYQAPRYTHAFWQPEQLFAAYDQAVEINENLEGFEYDPARNVWIKKLDMVLNPLTYIYLTQVILHNNRGRVTGVDGNSNLSGMARTTNVNTGKAGNDAVTVNYNTHLKFNCDKNGERVDIIGGRLMTFGICNLAAHQVTTAAEIIDVNEHFMDVTMNFNNGMDSTFVFNVTDQVRKRFKGGVLTIELDMDSIPIPKRKGGSAFDAVVKDYEDGGTHEFEM